MSIFSKKPPLKKQLEDAVLRTIFNVLTDNGIKPEQFDLKTLNAIKTSLAEIKERLEEMR